MSRGPNPLLGQPLARATLSLAAPMFLSGLLQNAQSLIDLFWVGRLGPDAVAAIAMSGTVMMMIFPMVMGAATGTLALVARAIGRGDEREASLAAAQSILLAVAMGAATAAVGAGLLAPLWRLLGAQQSVAVQGTQYLGILLYGVFTMNVLIIATSALQGAGNAVLPMSVMILSNLVNAALDPVLIFGLLGFPKMGVRGAALATVVAQAVSAAVLLAAMGRGVGGLRLHRGTWRPDPGLQWRILRVGVPSSGQMLLRSLMGMVLMRIVASCGTAAVAAYGIVLRFHMILLFPAFTMGNAAATLVGQHLGAGNPRRAAGAAWTATGIEVALMCFLSLFAWCFAPGLIAAFAPDPHVVGTGAACLRIQSPFFVASAFAIVLGRCMQGAGDTVPPMVFTLLALWGLQVPLATWLAHVWKPPTDGIWWASALAQLAHGLMVTLWFATGRWKHKRV